jgi:taurine dioxygenase
MLPIKHQRVVNRTKARAHAAAKGLRPSRSVGHLKRRGAESELVLRPLWDRFGVEIAGLDLSRKIPPRTWVAVLAALHRHLVVLFRGQKLTADEFIRLGRGFGEPISHVLDHLRLKGHPEIFVVSNGEDRPEAVRNGAAYWHTDQSYEAEPASATMLYAVRAPREGGETLFADMNSAYDELMEVQREQLGKLQVIHKYGNRDAGLYGEPVAAPLTEAQKERVAAITHPLVRPHPVTGRPSLFGVAGTSCGIVDWPDDRAKELLARLKDHVTQARYVRKHKYEVGDLIVWDTAATLHAGTPNPGTAGGADLRLLYRISVRGRPPLLQ